MLAAVTEVNRTGLRMQTAVSLGSPAQFQAGHSKFQSDHRIGDRVNIEGVVRRLLRRFGDL